MSDRRVVIVGGGFSGLAAAYTLSKKNISTVVLEKESKLGGVASSITLKDGRSLSTAYHHVVGTDKSLLAAIEDLDLSSRIRWKKISLVANIRGKRVNLSSPVDIMTKLSCLSVMSRIRYGLFGAKCLLKSNWREWKGKPIEELINRWTGEAVLKEIFEPLVDIKFGLSSKQVDAAWLGQRLHGREAATRFGYIPSASWPEEICSAYRDKIRDGRGEVILGDELKEIVIKNGKATRIITKRGKIYNPEAVLITCPPPIVISIFERAGLPAASLKPLRKIKYISSYSLIAGIPVDVFSDYWTIALQPRRIFAACFNLSKLNETLVNNKDVCVINLFTNVPFCEFGYDKDEYIGKAEKELSDMAGKKVKFNWAILNRLRYSSPIFGINYKNPPVQISQNIFFAGIYRAFPKLASTGSAILTGQEAAKKVYKYLQ